MFLGQSATDRKTPHPVILGTGLTGLAISQALSAAGIKHVLVGDRPTQSPRLGESINAEGSLEIIRQFPGFARFFTPKRRQVLFFGGHALAVDFTNLISDRVQDVLMGHPRRVDFLHVDRVGFDCALFDVAIADSHCAYVEGRVRELEYRSALDHIDAVVLADGQTIASSYVFDATNQTRFVARKLGVPRTVIGPRRRVVFAHYRRAVTSSGTPSAADCRYLGEASRSLRRWAGKFGRIFPDGDRTALATAASETSKLPVPPPWLQATSLIRLASRTDPVEGLAWCIPLEDYVSIGISVDPGTVAAAPTSLLDWVERAYAHRGIELRGAFPERGVLLDFPYEHYNHERCAGRNWLLTGPSCCQFWFPSAAGVATGLIAARLAPDLLRTPRETASLYQDYIDRLAAAHTGLDWLVEDDPASATGENLARRAETMVTGNIQRLGRYLSFKAPPLELAFGTALTKWYQSDRALANPWRVEAAPPEAQGTRLFATNNESAGPAGSGRLTRSDHPEAPKAIFGVVDVLSGQLTPERGRSLVTPALRVVIGEFILEGLEQWDAWVARLRGSGRVATLELVAGPLVAEGNGWRLTCQWQGMLGAMAVFSPVFFMIFTLDDERVAEIRSQRVDYAFVLGESVTSRVGFAAMLGPLLDEAAA